MSVFLCVCRCEWGDDKFQLALFEVNLEQICLTRNLVGQFFLKSNSSITVSKDTWKFQKINSAIETSKIPLHNKLNKLFSNIYMEKFLWFFWGRENFCWRIKKEMQFFFHFGKINKLVNYLFFEDIFLDILGGIEMSLW